MSLVRREIRVYGVVQGVGFRPFVKRMALIHQITGTVCNKGPYVEIFAQGSIEQLDAFQRSLKERAPARSILLKVDVKTCSTQEESGFSIVPSQKVKGDIFVSPDLAICKDCQQELFDPNNRRYLHPFINCTACGPRLTILDSMPYDRERTSMKRFPMCPDCHEEYTSMGSRRYHAQPVCCPDCGPELYLVGEDLRGKDALIQTRKKISQGKIVAIKGIGGFHLCCDATNAEAVDRLRILKQRPFKPFAVMVKDVDTAKREAQLLESQMDIFDGPGKPILLLPKKKGEIVPQVAPDNPTIGLMLPYAPLHLLLFDYPDGQEMPDCLVMTSANPKGAPICRTDQDVIDHLSHVCDLILSNDRPIRLRADDTVMNWYEDQPMMIRRSRGWAPLPLLSKTKGNHTVLGIGGELKNTFCLAAKDYYYLSPYIGDLSDVRSVQALKEAIDRMEELLEMKPEVVVCDLHPRYNSVQVAKQLGLPVLQIQHHYAHILSCMVENQVSDPVIGVSFDGTGYGLDGSIWGGEFLLCDPHGFERIGSLEPFEQIGGDLSSKEGWRIAVALLKESPDWWEALDLCTRKEGHLLMQMVNQKINTVPSTSAGRLFDAVSAILGLCRVNSCEAEASMKLQFHAQAHQGSALPYERSIGKKDFFTLPIVDLVSFFAQKRLEGEDVDALAYTFHVVLARWICEGCLEARNKYKRNIVALSGGVMQNVLLVELCQSMLEKEGFQVLLQRQTSANDGGIALGQAYYGMENV